MIVAVGEQDLAAVELERVGEGVGDDGVLEDDPVADVLGAVGVALAEVGIVGLEEDRDLVPPFE